MVKNLPTVQETSVWSLGWEDPLEKGMAAHSGILAWRIPWTEEPGGLQSMRSQRVGHNWANNTGLVSMSIRDISGLKLLLKKSISRLFARQVCYQQLFPSQSQSWLAARVWESMLEWILKVLFISARKYYPMFPGQHLLERRAIHSAHMAASAPSFPVDRQTNANLVTHRVLIPRLERHNIYGHKIMIHFIILWLKRFKYLYSEESVKITRMHMQYFFVLSTCILTKCLCKCNCIWLRRKDMTFITYYRSLAIYSVSEVKTKNILPQHHSVICFLFGSPFRCIPSYILGYPLFSKNTFESIS